MKTSRLFRTAAVLGASMMFLFSAPIACNLISGVNDLAFKEAGCHNDGDCPAGVNECQTATCLQGVCGIVMQNDVPAPTQATGDCKINLCRDGEVVAESDDFDIVVTATDCDEEKCENGQLLNSLRAEREGCNTSGGRLCNGQGVCVECLQASDCAASSNPCMQPFCEANGKCVMHPVPKDSPIAKQQLADCSIVVCDGAGATTNAADDADIEDDANECTMDSCANRVPIHLPVPPGTTCGQGLNCDASGQCFGCTSDSQCSISQTCGGGGTAGVCACNPKTCESEGRTCGPLWDGCSKYVYCDNGSMDGTEQGIDCGDSGNACGPCGMGAKCTSNDDCLTAFCVDGVCCNEACTGTCRACSSIAKGGGLDGICGPIGYGSDPDDECPATNASGCGTNGVCNGAGACAKHDNGTICKSGSCNAQTGGGAEYTEPSRCFNGTCEDPTTIACAGVCVEKEGCFGCTTDGECPNGSFCDANACKPKLPRGAACTKNDACESAFCADGVCCNNACSDPCQSCNQGGTNNGNCLPVAMNKHDPDTCATNEVCSADGACKLANGEPGDAASVCASGFFADGVCCDTACTEPCKGCNIPGKAGECLNLGLGQSELIGCTAPEVCDGFGGCRKSIGTKCGESGDLLCENGSSCVDGYCCNEVCDGACHACNVAGALGYCVLVPMDMPDPDTCMANQRCDSAGQCKDIAGQTCSTNAECLNDNCVDGYCCISSCSGTCEQCTSSGQCGNVPQYQTDADTCTSGMVCDGAGACKKDNGATCSTAGECASGYCVDGVCCESACTTNCMQCDKPGSLGTCSNVPFNIGDGACSGTQACDGMTVCKKKAGQTCSAFADCLSGYCVDGVCCDSECATDCLQCNRPGNLGTCSNVPVNIGDGACNGLRACDGAGACRDSNGQTCGNATDCLSGFCVDGYCCNTSCSGTCKACNVVNSVGICSNVPINNGDGACSGSSTCDGTGVCRKINGQTCGTTTDCLSGLCVDGVCCNNSCSGICQACNVPNSVGICSNVPVNNGDGACSGSSACDGAGVCRKINGQTCGNAAECLSGSCVDGYCCDTSCSGTCKACNVPNFVGICSNVPVNLGDGACSGTSACDGAGACKKINGQTCGNAAECLSANCVDGVCCDTSCSGTCQACNVVNFVGTCHNVPLYGSDTNTCISPQACDGAGSCKGLAGASCLKDNDCFSGICTMFFCAP